MSGETMGERLIAKARRASSTAQESPLPREEDVWRLCVVDGVALADAIDAELEKLRAAVIRETKRGRIAEAELGKAKRDRGEARDEARRAKEDAASQQRIAIRREEERNEARTLVRLLVKWDGNPREELTARASARTALTRWNQEKK